MTNYAHTQIADRLSAIDFPPEKTDEFEAWLTARDHLELVRKNAREDEIIVYASGESVFIHAVAVGEEAVDPPLIDDLLRWGGNPFQASTVSYVYGSDPEDIRLEATPPIDGSDSLANAKPLILGRTRYDQPTGGTDYFEVVQEYSVLADIHCYREHGAYCRYDHRGDLLPVVTISSPTSSINTLVSFSHDELDEYLAVSGQLIVRMFDFSMLRRAAFHGWPDREEVHKAGDLFYRQAISPGTAGSARGVQIIRPRRARSAILRRLRSKVFGEKTRAVEFEVWDWRNRRLATVSTDRATTTTYFDAERNTLPFEISPAFFRPEVLAKYRNDTDKYQIDGRTIICRGAWSLRGVDVNAAGQVHTYIRYLRELPYDEQVYWKSFNEPPKAGISERAIRNDFAAEWIDLSDPLDLVKQVLRQWDEHSVAWWRLPHEGALERVTTPRTDSVDEWAREFKHLAILVVEGMSVREIRRRLEAEQIAYDREKDGSIALLEKMGRRRLVGLREVQLIRSKLDAHARGEEGSRIVKRSIEKHGSLTAHFNAVCLMVRRELEELGEAVAGRPST